MRNSEPSLAQLQSAYAMLGTAPQEAIIALQALAEKGSALAPLYLGWAAQEGNGTVKDVLKAEYWFKIAIEREEETSAYYLGHLYLALGRHEDSNWAFEKGSNWGHSPATYCLAMNIIDGKAESQSLERARGLLEVASNQGHAFARRALASLYMSGQFGILKIPQGLWLLLQAIVGGGIAAFRGRNDDRLRA